MKKIILIFLLLFNIFFCFINADIKIKGNSLEVFINENDKSNFDKKITSKSAILLEPKTNTIIYEKDALERLAPASMTKIITMILVCEALDANKVTLDQMLTTSKYAESMGGTQIYLEENEKMSVEDLLKSVAIASANDAAVVLAEGISGTCEEFVNLMNKKGKELGFKNSNFVNPNGLPEENHYSCAYDMGIAASYLINNYGDFILKYTSLYEDYVREDLENKFWLVNTNKLIRLEGIDGLKTGRTEEAGYCLTCTMKKDNVRMISVVMGAKTIDDRTNDTLMLLNYGINVYDIKKVYNKGDIIENINNVLYNPRKIDVIINKDIYILVRKGEELGNIVEKKDINYKVIKNGKIGEIEIYVDDLLIDKADLIIKNKVKKANVFSIIFEIFEKLFY